MVQVEEEAAAMGFPVVLDHGKRQIKVGSIDMHPTFEFKEYRTMLAEMVGVSHNKLTSYFVDNTKHLITSKVDFSTFGGKNGFFLVVLKKRSRKERRRKKTNKNWPPLVDLFNFRLNHSGKTASQMPEDDGKVDIWPQELEIMKKKANNNTNFKIQDSDEDYNYLCSHTNTNFPSMNELATYPEDERPKIIDLPSFHHFCRYDKILEGVFRSPYGPIARPVKVEEKRLTKSKYEI